MRPPVQYVGVTHRPLDLDSVPVSVPQIAGAPENLHLWLQTSEYDRYGQYIAQKPDFQLKNRARMRNIESVDRAQAIGLIASF
jgi:hypothetical protein